MTEHDNHIDLECPCTVLDIRVARAGIRCDNTRHIEQKARHAGTRILDESLFDLVSKPVHHPACMLLVVTDILLAQPMN